MTSRLTLLLTCLTCCALPACVDQSSAGTDPTPDMWGIDQNGDDPGQDAAADAQTHEGSDMSTSAQDASQDTKRPFAELYEQGLLRHLGSWTPSQMTQARNGGLLHWFRGDDGPRCFTGEDFFVATRDGRSDDLMIFLQGGGACGPNDCGATESWPAIIPGFGILNPSDETNPAAEFDVGYVPYCDGSLFTGDAEYDLDGDGTIDRSFRGLMNLSAALDVIAARYPSPPRILLIGNSAGGMGVHFALPLVRALYPDIAIDMVNDSGVGILAPGSMEELSEYWNSGAFFPASCDDCISEQGHLTGYHAYQLREDRNLRLGYLSSRQDEVIVESLARTTGEAYEAALLEATATLKQAHGERFNSMIMKGSDHTFVVRDFARDVAETSVRAWLEALLEPGGTWMSVTE